jgi:hypothetical protein
MKEKQSPRITHISRGHKEVEGLGSGKDFKLYPGGGREWDWRETNTEHSPGYSRRTCRSCFKTAAR